MGGTGDAITDIESLRLAVQLADLLVVAVVVELQVQLVGAEVGHGAGGRLQLLALAVRRLVLGGGAAALHPVDHLLEGDKVDVGVIGLHLLDELEEALPVALLLDPVFAQVKRERGSVAVVEAVEVLHEEVEDLILGGRVVDGAVVVEEEAAGGGGALSFGFHFLEKGWGLDLMIKYFRKKKDKPPLTV